MDPVRHEHYRKASKRGSIRMVDFESNNWTPLDFLITVKDTGLTSKDKVSTFVYNRGLITLS